MTHEELQHEIEYLRTQLAICESKKAATQKAEKHSESTKEQLRQKASELIEAEDIAQTFADLSEVIGKEIRKTHPLTIATTFALGFLVGRIFSK